MVGRTALAAMAVVCLCGPGAAQDGPDIPVVRLEAIYGRQAAPAPSLPVIRIDDGEQASGLDAGRAVSLTFAEPLPVRDVLLLLFRGTPFSVVFDPSVAAVFVGELSNLSLRGALEAVLMPAGLDYELRDRVIHVFPRRMQTRLFEVSHVAGRRTWRRQVLSRGTGDGAGVAADLTSEVTSDFFGELSDGVRALLSPTGRAHVDRKAGIVQVTDFADRLQQVGVYVETVVLRATRQIRLSARVIEVTLTEHDSINWAAVGSAGVRSASGAGITVADFDAFLRGLSAFGAVRTIASPQVLAMNNEPAVIRIGPNAAAFARAGEAPATSAAAAGLTLTITPQINAEGMVHMNVAPTYADASVVEVDTTLRVRGGDTVVIAGLMRAGTREVAAGGLSRFFGAKDSVASRTELVLLLTPTVVNPGSSPVAGAQ